MMVAMAGRLGAADEPPQSNHPRYERSTIMYRRFRPTILSLVGLAMVAAAAAVPGRAERRLPTGTSSPCLMVRT